MICSGKSCHHVTKLRTTPFSRVCTILFNHCLVKVMEQWCVHSRHKSVVIKKAVVSHKPFAENWKNLHDVCMEEIRASYLSDLSLNLSVWDQV